jgi:hypothetical protein
MEIHGGHVLTNNIPSRRLIFLAKAALASSRFAKRRMAWSQPDPAFRRLTRPVLARSCPSNCAKDRALPLGTPFTILSANVEQAVLLVKDVTYHLLP